MKRKKEMMKENKRKSEKKEKFKSKECACCEGSSSIGQNEGIWAKKMKSAHIFGICSASFEDSL